MIVADTNLAAYLAFESSYSPAVQALHQSDSHWIAPHLWLSEIRQVVLKHLRTTELTLQRGLYQLHRLEALFDERLYEVSSSEVLRLASGSGCSSYDCEFVALAQQMNCQLVTMDKQVLKAFPDTARLLEKNGVRVD
ncbi:MAG: type II toxin-antitoxin system VapC family toxin [Halieaceae bacterium]